MSLSQLRPRSATEIADAAIQLVRRHFGSLIVLSALVAIPGLVVGAAQLWLMPGESLASIAPGALFPFFVLSVVGMVFFFVGMGALVRSVSAAYVDGQVIEPAAAIRLALGRGWRLVAANLLAYLRVALFTALAIVAIMLVASMVVGVLFGTGTPIGGSGEMLIGLIAIAIAIGISLVMVFAFARYATVTPVVMLEDAGARAAVRRARELSAGHVRRSAGLILVVFVLYLLVYLSILGIASMLLRDTQLAGVVASVATVPLYPMVAAIITVLYYDLRIRREGFDIELLARELDDASAGEGAVGPSAIVPASEGAR